MRRRWVLHPLLIGVYPILALYARNVYETSPQTLAMPIGLALAGTLAVWLALWLPTRDAQRAGLATSLLTALFFAFSACLDLANHLLYYLNTFWVERTIAFPPVLMLALLAIVAATALHLIFRRLKRPAPWTFFLNTFALVLVALPTSSVVLARMREPARPIVHNGRGVPTAAHPARRPDIYYIILDGYARSDIMKDLFGFDNRPFLRRLEQRGFFVAHHGTSNYCMTSMSLCSSLNFNYLDKLIDPSAHDATPVASLIGDNLIIKSLRPHGYKFVTFSTGYDPTEHPEADVYLYPSHHTANFHGALIDKTPLTLVRTAAAFKDYYAYTRERTLFVFDKLPEVTTIKEPTFTFAHIVNPHAPFVFGENGEDVSPRHQTRKTYGSPTDYREGYRKQAIYLTRRVEEMIVRILARSPEPPIIILQSDHGSGLLHHMDDLEKTDLRERMSNLNCYYFPDRQYDELTDHITPVNSFRVVLNHFFGAHLPLLEERNYFSLYSDPLVFIDVTDRLRAEQAHPQPHQPPQFYFHMLE